MPSLLLPTVTANSSLVPLAASVGPLRVMCRLNGSAIRFVPPCGSALLALKLSQQFRWMIDLVQYVLEGATVALGFLRRITRRHVDNPVRIRPEGVVQPLPHNGKIPVGVEAGNRYGKFRVSLFHSW